MRKIVLLGVVLAVGFAPAAHAVCGPNGCFGDVAKDKTQYVVVIGAGVIMCQRIDSLVIVTDPDADAVYGRFNVQRAGSQGNCTELPKGAVLANFPYEGGTKNGVKITMVSRNWQTSYFIRADQVAVFNGEVKSGGTVIRPSLTWEVPVR